jgi:hypothetical protein
MPKVFVDELGVGLCVRVLYDAICTVLKVFPVNNKMYMYCMLGLTIQL